MTEELTLHGNFLSIFGVGTLIMGEAGIGKSELTLGLINKNHQLVTDDLSIFTRVENRIMGRNPSDNHYISIRGIGLFDISLLFGPGSVQSEQELKLIILLTKEASSSLKHLIGEHNTEDILGCLIPCISIPIIAPRNLELIVETLVKNFILMNNNEYFPLKHFEELLGKQ
jgi:HPr kinase/phosphorylase